MTPPKFTIQDGYLKELLGEDKPNARDYGTWQTYHEAATKYEQSLRTYRVANPSDWDNVPMPIGEDGFEVRKASELFCNSSMKELYAVPTQPAKGQSFNVTREQLEQLWQDANSHGYGGKDDQDMKKYIDELITPKPQ